MTLSKVSARPRPVQPESRLRDSGESTEHLAQLVALAAAQKRALNVTLHGSSRPLRDIAQRAGISYSFLANAAIASSTDQLPFPRQPIVLASCDELTFLRFLADLQHADVLPRPRVDFTVDDVQRGASTMREFAEFMSASAGALGPGDAVDPERFAELEREGLEAIAAIRMLMAFYRARVNRPLLEDLR